MEMKKYGFTYIFDNQRWAISIYADNPEQAEEKIKAVSQATYDGEIVHTIPVPVKENSLIARLLIKLAKYFSKSSKTF